MNTIDSANHLFRAHKLQYGDSHSLVLLTLIGSQGHGSYPRHRPEALPLHL